MVDLLIEVEVAVDPLVKTKGKRAQVVGAPNDIALRIASDDLKRRLLLYAFGTDSKLHVSFCWKHESKRRTMV